MAYLTEAQLRNVSRASSFSEYGARLRDLKRSDAKVSIFLSHSHRDLDLVEALIVLFSAEAGLAIYVDYKDSDMPAVTNRASAERLKLKIADLDYFMVLATQNALESHWVPWEIGIADSRKASDKIVIIPVADPQGVFHGNEYLQLYHAIEYGEGNVLGVFPPGISQGTTFKSWIAPRA
jgi:hypothetical protein